MDPYGRILGFLDRNMPVRKIFWPGTISNEHLWQMARETNNVAE
jgi:hypothetical protein